MSKTSTVKKVGNSKTEEKEPKGRIDFPKNTARYVDEKGNITSAINNSGQLIAVPVKIAQDNKVVYAGFDVRKHNPLKKEDFASLAIFLKYTGYVARQKAEFFLKLAEDREAKADRLLKFGDEQTRKKAVKIARMREQLKALEDQLVAEGIDVQSL